MPSGTSREVFKNPSLYEHLISSIMLFTCQDLIVWREAYGKPNKLVFYPSSKIKSEEMFEIKLGELISAAIGHPMGAEQKDENLWARVRNRAGENYYIEYHDAPTERLRQLLKDLYNLAKERCGEGEKTPLRIILE